MGRRSINTTKSGKYMNPTDQARKEARKKELKKNKKQRQMVRQAVLKNKDPAQLLEEMEKIDEMEYNVLQPSPLNEKVLKEKRKKLKETFDRVMRLLQEDDSELYSEMKRKEVEYEKRKYKRVQYFESVRHAEQVSIDDIPLPSSTVVNEKPLPTTMPKISLPPPVLLTNISSIIPPKKTNDPILESMAENKLKEPPGIPPYMPPNIFEMHELNNDYESDEEYSMKIEESNLKDDQLKDKHDQNIEEFMKEVESVQKKKEDEKAEMIIDPTPEVVLGNEESSAQKEVSLEPIEVAKKIQPEPSIILPPQPFPPMSMPRMPLMFRPPPLRHMIRMPPGPPPSSRPGIRMAPGPPPRHKHHDRNQMLPLKQSTTTITAKPQIRNLSADVTRFVPSTLRSKRDEPRKAKPKSYISEAQMHQMAMQQKQQQTQTKDDAYQQFMSEMQDFL